MTERKQQVVQALDMANRRRLERAAIHQHMLATGGFEESCVELAKILDDNPPPGLGGMRVEELLQWLRPLRGYPSGHRRHKNRVIADTLEAAGCSEFKLVRELTPRQRTLIVDTLTSHAYGRMAA